MCGKIRVSAANMDDHFDKEGPLAAITRVDEEIKRACKTTADLLDVLIVLEVINEEEQEEADSEEEYESVIDKLKGRIKDDPNFFIKFCTAIQEKASLRDLAEKLLAINSEIQTGELQPEATDRKKPVGSSRTSAPLENGNGCMNTERDTGQTCRLKIDDQLKKLRKQLNVLQEIPSESEELKASKLMMTKNAMKTFITTSLDMGGDAQSIYAILQNLHEKDADIIIDGDVYQWCIGELETRNALKNPDSPSLQHTENQHLSEVCLNKEIVQNSIFACHTLGNVHVDIDVQHLSHPHSLREINRSQYLKLQNEERKNSQQKDDFLESFNSTSTESTFDSNLSCRVMSSTSANNLYLRSTESDCAISKHQFSEAATYEAGAAHQYLIAKGAVKPNGHVIYYIAFSSHQSLKEWNDGHTSFDDGFKKQEKQLPIQFILEKLWEGASVVVTGFSFGGILAHLCALHLWNLSQGICPELLDRNLLCVTFGQPLLSLSRMASITDKIADKSRFHAIYINGDIIPRMMRYLDPTYTKLNDCGLPEKFRKQNKSDEIFQNHVSTSIMRQLLVLEECNVKHSQMQRAVHDIGRNIRQKIDEKWDGHRAGERRKHRCSDGPSSMDAIQDLRTMLRPLKHQRSSIMPSYVTPVQVVENGLRKTGDMGFPAIEEIEEDMFNKHSTDEYIGVIKSQYSCKEFEFEEADKLASSSFVKPTVKRLEIHHFSHHETAALSLDGDNLFFTSRCFLSLHKSETDLEFIVDQRESVSSRSIQIQEVSLPIPRDFISSADSNASGNCQETEETASVRLFTNFGDFTFENVEVKHKKFFISCRKQQVANLSIAEVIELSFLGALLERHPRNAHSKRYKVIHDFLDVIIDIVPIESTFSCIASMSSDQNARHLCQVLKQSNVKPPLSSTLFISAALGITKLRCETVHFNDTATLEDLFYVFVVAAKKRSLPVFWSKQSLSQIIDESRYLKWFGPEIASNCRNGDMVRYLQKIVDEAISSNAGRIPAISGINMRTFFEAMEMQNSDRNPMSARFATIKSPKCLLKEGRRELNTLQTIAREKLKTHGHSNAEKEFAFTKAHNAMLLDYVKKLRSEDLYMCIQLIIAFMEDQVRIPISDYFNLTISYWQLLKLGLGIFRRKVSKDITQYISVGKHIRSIADDTSHTVDPYQTTSAVNSKYAGKLQFLLSATLRQDEPLLIDDKYLMYSLESRLYMRFTNANVPTHLRIDDKTPLETIEENWDILFKDVGLSKVVHSHRRLVARWLKFSLMIHKLRAELSCHATVGIVGLVNSGKSTLVKELFKIETIETGTREEKRTTVPFLYSIPEVENFDVIDFPGVDDQDDNISDLVNLLRTLSQLVVFVVNYRNAHTQAAVEWYRKLNQHAIPHLVCLTHGDRLYAECTSDEGRDPTYAKKAINKQVEIIREKIKSKTSDSPMRSLGLYSLRVDNDSVLKSAEGQRSIRDAGISGVKDVGKWIVSSLEDHLKENMTAQILKSYFGLT